MTMPAPQPQPLKILVVDDEVAIRELLVEILADEGYTVRVASNGRAAVTMVQRERPDLMLMDVMMPGLDGPATLHHLRTLPDPVVVPTVLMSAAHHFNPDGAEAVAFISKPFNLEHLLAVVAHMLCPAGK